MLRAASRRSHAKSRTGCKTCKLRKIKCDESRPACGNCIKHNVDCDFIVPPDSGSNLSSPAAGPAHGLDVSTLELLHNFSTRTYSTLSENLILRDFYRTTAVQLGLECEFILRALLAVSAMHLAHYRVNMRHHYQSLAMSHHQAAAREAMPLMTDVNSSTADKLFLFSVITIYFALACPRKSDGALLVEESGFPDWMFLLQGTHAFVPIIGLQTASPLAPLLNHGADRWLTRSNFPDPSSRVHEHLDSMRALIELRQSDINLRTIYVTAIDELQKAFSVFERLGSDRCDLTDAFVWVFEMAGTLLPLLRVPTQEAVAILAFFAVLLKRLEKHWYLQGWADHLIAKAYGLLDEERRIWIQWPLQEIGWMP